MAALDFFFDFDQHLATIVGVAVAVFVRTMHQVFLTSDRASGYSGRYRLFMRPALVLSLLRYSTLRMCHRYLKFMVIHFCLVHWPASGHLVPAVQLSFDNFFNSSHIGFGFSCSSFSSGAAVSSPLLR